MTFTIPGNPEGKDRARFGNGHAYTPAKTVNYMQYVQYCFAQAGGKRTDKPISVNITVHIPFPASMPKKVKLQAYSGFVVPTKKPDNDNIEKVVFDALNHLAYKDDTQIVENHTTKVYSDDPKVVVEIKKLPVLYYYKNKKWVKVASQDEKV